MSSDDRKNTTSSSLQQNEKEQKDEDLTSLSNDAAPTRQPSSTTEIFNNVERKGGGSLEHLLLAINANCEAGDKDKVKAKKKDNVDESVFKGTEKLLNVSPNADSKIVELVHTDGVSKNDMKCVPIKKKFSAVVSLLSTECDKTKLKCDLEEGSTKHPSVVDNVNTESKALSVNHVAKRKHSEASYTIEVNAPLKKQQNGKGPKTTTTLTESKARKEGTNSFGSYTMEILCTDFGIDRAQVYKERMFCASCISWEKLSTKNPEAAVNKKKRQRSDQTDCQKICRFKAPLSVFQFDEKGNIMPPKPEFLHKHIPQSFHSYPKSTVLQNSNATPTANSTNNLTCSNKVGENFHTNMITGAASAPTLVTPFLDSTYSDPVRLATMGVGLPSSSFSLSLMNRIAIASQAVSIQSKEDTNRLSTCKPASTTFSKTNNKDDDSVILKRRVKQMEVALKKLIIEKESLIKAIARHAATIEEKKKEIAKQKTSETNLKRLLKQVEKNHNLYKILKSGTDTDFGLELVQLIKFRTGNRANENTKARKLMTIVANHTFGGKGKDFMRKFVVDESKKDDVEFEKLLDLIFAKMKRDGKGLEKIQKFLDKKCRNEQRKARREENKRRKEEEAGKSAVGNDDEFSVNIPSSPSPQQHITFHQVSVSLQGDMQDAQDAQAQTHLQPVNNMPNLPNIQLQQQHDRENHSIMGYDGSLRLFSNTEDSNQWYDNY